VGGVGGTRSGGGVERVVVQSNNSSNIGVGEDERRRCEAHHIIDILEDVGMKFMEEGEVNVKRFMELEVRDRGDLVDWEQRHTSQ
jgi:hypothetical protein